MIVGYKTILACDGELHSVNVFNTTTMCRDNCIVTVSIGIGSNYANETLLDIAGNESRVFEISKHSNLNNITVSLLRLIEETAANNIEGKSLFCSLFFQAKYLFYKPPFFLTRLNIFSQTKTLVTMKILLVFEDDLGNGTKMT